MDFAKRVGLLLEGFCSTVMDPQKDYDVGLSSTCRSLNWVLMYMYNDRNSTVEVLMSMRVFQVKTILLVQFKFRYLKVLKNLNNPLKFLKLN